MGKLRKENQKNRELRMQLEELVLEECTRANVEPAVTYNLFVGLRNTGEKIKLPDNEEILEKILNRCLEGKEKGKVLLTHRNLHVTL